MNSTTVCVGAPRGEHLGHAELLELGDVVERDRAAHGHEHVADAVLPQQVHRRGTSVPMLRTREDREADHVGIPSCTDGRRRSAPASGAGRCRSASIPASRERAGDDLRAAVVPVQSRLRHHHPDRSHVGGGHPALRAVGICEPEPGEEAFGSGSQERAGERLAALERLSVVPKPDLLGSCRPPGGRWAGASIRRRVSRCRCRRWFGGFGRFRLRWRVRGRRRVGGASGFGSLAAAVLSWVSAVSTVFVRGGRGRL